MTRTQVISDGTPGGTKVLVDGRAVDCVGVTFTARVGEAAKVVVELYADDVDIVIEGPEVVKPREIVR